VSYDGVNRLRVKTPAKFADCAVGDELAELFVENNNESSPIEPPIVHRQVYGRVVFPSKLYRTGLKSGNKRFYN